MNTIVFCGFGKLGYLCLSTLYDEGYVPLAILTHKDMSEEAVDYFASQKKIPFYYSDLRKDHNLMSEMNSVSFTYLISVNYRYIIPQNLLNRAKYPLNLHGSLLPKYRGRTPHVWAIINGEHKTGVTCHVMESTVDTGPIYKQIELNIKNEDTGGSILEKFYEIYPLCLMESLTQIQKGIQPKPQNHLFATYFGKRTPEMGYIDVKRNVQGVLNFIRAQARPYPGAYLYLPTGQKLIAHAAKIFELREEVIDEIGMSQYVDEGYLLTLINGKILITDYEIQ
ncbi:MULTISPECIES: methionyl-tRNA formyltransferase [Leptospira]|uniref:Formyl transferase domain protein n=3 Tax=Leptospiraceae TaxID=170 RepID=A0A0E2AYZ8_9LEPT|nr:MULTISPECIES: formyltransferase family protein [Leptospira]ADC94033.1 methionyl-tRNA formyltransferase [Leptospira interrogans serovar Grippotyphosa]AJR14898.1 methionyl-tRNA formyltransferase [Leptospira interrogans serovar Linhai str. 56609]EKO14101.1 formyl transferase domain protein [Leptospira kirschneri str. H1]EMN52457.1 formyl transferase domain protein [Leptospira interrogans serovar Autumnalis str. LP101]